MQHLLQGLPVQSEVDARYCLICQTSFSDVPKFDEHVKKEFRHRHTCQTCMLDFHHIHALQVRSTSFFRPSKTNQVSYLQKHFICAHSSSSFDSGRLLPMHSASFGPRHFHPSGLTQSAAPPFQELSALLLNDHCHPYTCHVCGFSSRLEKEMYEVRFSELEEIHSASLLTLHKASAMSNHLPQTRCDHPTWFLMYYL